MLQDISRWIGAHQVATICCPDDEKAPHCFCCFYLFHPSSRSLLFKSSPRSRHASLLEPGTAVAGTILPAAIDFSALQGIQFSGTVENVQAGGEDLYHERFPNARAIPGSVYCVRLARVKMTDNGVVFGHKLHWNAG